MPGYSSYKEGEPYTYFTAKAYNADNASRVVYDGGKYTGNRNAAEYWLRSRYISTYYTYFLYINTTGKCDLYGSDNIQINNSYYEYAILPVLRL
jgi:hypothetical protein